MSAHEPQNVFLNKDNVNKMNVIGKRYIHVIIYNAEFFAIVILHLLFSMQSCSTL